MIEAALRIRITLMRMRIRILLFTSMRTRIRILPVTLIRIRILPFNLLGTYPDPQQCIEGSGSSPGFVTLANVSGYGRPAKLICYSVLLLFFLKNVISFQVPDLVENFDEVSKNEAATEDAKISDVTGGHRYIINLCTFSQCCGSMEFLYGSESAGPYIWLIDPDADPDPQHCFFDEVAKNEAVT